METFVLHLGKNNWKINIRDEVDRSVFNEIFRIGEYRASEISIIEAKDPIVDIGAHAGFFSLYCRALNEKVKIFAVEPEMDNLEAIKRHIKENKLKNIEVIEGAIAGESGKLNLFVSEDSHNHSIIGEASKDTLQKVNVFSFSDFLNENKIKRISLLKMDIEGAEYEVFESLTKKDLAVVNFVILEYHNGIMYKQIENKLRENGFGVQIFPSKFDKTMGFLWAKNKKVLNSKIR